MDRLAPNVIRLDAPAQGRDGRTTLSGARAPTMADGRVGDFWVDTAAKKLYGPKNAAAWPDNGVIKGDRGWAPELAAEAYGEKRLMKIVDWFGGEGTKPATTGYLGPEGFTANPELAIDFRGPPIDVDAMWLEMSKARLLVVSGATRTITSTDLGKLLKCTNAAGCTVTLPADLPEGFATTLLQRSAGVISLVEASGATLDNIAGQDQSAAQFGVLALLVHENSDGSSARWLVSGNTGS